MRIDADNIELRFILKLIKDTKKGEINWESTSNSSLSNLPSTEKPVSKVYTSVISKKTLRIYEFQVKSYTDEDEWDWIQRVRLEIIDENSDTIYEYNYDYSLYKLFKAVREMNSGVDDFMKDFLEK